MSDKMKMEHLGPKLAMKGPGKPSYEQNIIAMQTLEHCRFCSNKGISLDMNNIF